MAVGFDECVGMVVVIVATPFKMCEKPCMVMHKFFNGYAAVLGGMFGNDDVTIHIAKKGKYKIRNPKSEKNSKNEIPILKGCFLVT